MTRTRYRCLYSDKTQSTEPCIFDFCKHVYTAQDELLEHHELTDHGTRWQKFRMCTGDVYRGTSSPEFDSLQDLVMWLSKERPDLEYLGKKPTELL